jgi:hypothetical protein
MGMIDPFTIKQIAEVTSKTIKSDVPALGKIEIKDGKASFSGEQYRSFKPLVRDIPDFKNCNKTECISDLTKSNSSSLEGNAEGTQLSSTFRDDSTQRSFTNSEGINRNIPKSDGCWTGQPGNSTWRPNPESIPQKWNPENSTWQEILDKYDIDGIEFKDGEPDFSKVAEDSVEIDEYSTDRDDNYDAADQKLAEKWTAEQKDGKSWSAEDIAQYRKDNQLSWHERNDMKTMELVPREIHLNVPHSGGISIANNNVNTGKGLA